MPNPIKYNASSQESSSLRKGNFYIGSGDVSKGPTVSTGFWNGMSPSSDGYVIYLNKASDGPSIYAPQDDTSLIEFTNRIAGTSYTTVNQCFNYYAGQSDKMVLNRDFSPIITKDLMLDFEGSFIPSYPRNGTVWYDLSSSGPNNTSLSNGPSYNNEGGGSITFDGSDDYANFYCPNLSGTATVEIVCKIGSGYGGKMIFGWLYYDVWCGGNNLGYNTAQGDVYGISSSTVSSLGLVDTWKHYVFEMRSDVSYTNNKIYVNGVAQTLSQQSGGEGTGNRNFNSGYGRIACWLADLGYPMPMNCNSFRIYNRSLSQSEILQNYYKAALITDSITHRWDFSNIVSYPSLGTAVKNLKGTVNATLYNGPYFYSQYGGYLNFDGSDDYMLLDSSINMGNGDSAWTISAWVRTTSSVDGLGNGSVISNSSGGPVYSMLGVNLGKIVYWTYQGGWVQNLGSITVNDGNWHMLTWVNYSDYSMDMYVDGVLDAEQFYSASGNNNPLNMIGGSWAARFNGDIGEVQINTKSFSSVEVKKQYEATKLRYDILLPPVTDGLILYWDPSNPHSYPGYGTEIYDLTGNGYTGTLYNGVGFSMDYGGVLRFDGIDDFVYGGPNMSFSNYTLMGAARYVSISGRVIAGGNNWLLGHWAGYTNDHYAEGWVYYNPSISNTDWAIYTGSGNPGAGSYQFYMNNQLLASNGGGGGGPAGISLGAGGGGGYEFSNAEVGPILLYDRVLTPSELTQNYNYLKSRFGLR